MPFKTEPRMCGVAGCQNRAKFSVQVVLSTLQRKPKLQLASKTLALCDSCVNPNAGDPWGEFKRAIAFKVWAVRTDLLHKLEKPIIPNDEGETECPTGTVLSASDKEPIADGSEVAKSGDASTRAGVPTPGFVDRKLAAAGGE